MTPVYRVVQGTIQSPVTPGPAGAQKYRQVFDSTLKDFRWTGRRPLAPGSLSPELARVVRTGPPAGGLYVACSLNDAGLGEFTTYASSGSQRTTFDDDVRRRVDGQRPRLDSQTFQTKWALTRVFEYVLPAGLVFVNLSIGASEGRSFLDALVTDLAGASGRPDPDEKQRADALIRALSGKSPRAAYTDPDDYSFCRGLGQAIRDFMPRCRGLRVTSVRSDAGLTFSEYSGDNLVLFAPDGHTIADLTPVKELSFSRRASGPMETKSTPL